MLQQISMLNDDNFEIKQKFNKERKTKKNNK